MKEKTIVIGLSGGVDSSVAALLLKKKGYKVIGAFMKNFSDTKNTLTGECNWVEEKKMAEKIASIIKIPLVTFDFEKEYKKNIISKMYKAYSQNLTPNPDILCNSLIKFPLFWKESKKLNADLIAFGHYAKIKKTPSGYHLLSGKDKSKDQSYFLSELSQKDLSHTIFPIGNYTKKEIREIAKRNKFPNWNKKSTSGICFVGKINFQKFLKHKIKKKEGKIINPEGKTLGSHQGAFFFTIGQRLGPHLELEIEKPKGSEQKKWYVAKKLKNNIILAAPENHPLLKTNRILIKNIHIINPNLKIPKFLKARVRHLGSLHSGKLEKKQKGYSFTFSKPIESVAPGQFIVFYKKDEVLASGEIST